MRGTWVLALAASATLAVAVPSAAEAQSRSIRERWEESARRDQREDDDKDRERARERERERAQAAERERVQAAERERERARVAELERERRAEAVRREEWERQRRINSAEQRRREEERERLGNRRDRDRDDDDWYDDDGRNGNGPAFCRSGAGHPVHGREWCRRRGYDVGRDRGWDRSDRDRWGNIVFRDSRRHRRDERLNRSVLAGLLGNTWVNRLESHGRRYGSGPLNGYWLPRASGNVLELHIGSAPYARLIDFNRDGRVDDLLFRR
jgi:hypothetical protein